MNLVHFSSKSIEWSTPQFLFDILDKEWKFELDVCASRENAKCKDFFTVQEDGLTRSWKGKRCFMNPPYGRQISHWVKKAWTEAQSGTLVVALLPARTDTNWWYSYCLNSEIRFIKGRLKFGGVQNSAPFPSAIVIFSRPFKVTWEDYSNDIKI